MIKCQYLLRILGIFMAIASFVTTRANAQGPPNWVIETVDSTGDKVSSLVLDSDGSPHIYYWSCQWNGRYYDCDLKHAHYEGMSWHIEVVGSFGDVTKGSLIIEAAGHLHISYLDWASRELRYAYYDDTAWITETVDYGTTGGFALDTAGRPHMSYNARLYSIQDQFYQTYLHYAYNNGTDWIIETVDSGIGWRISLALDADDHRHISYYGGYLDLKYAYSDGTNWITETVDDEGDVGWDNSLVLDTAGRPHISYHERISDGDGNLKYAYYDGTAWQIEVVDEGSNVGYGISLALDAADHPHISYYDSTRRDLKYAYYNGPT